MCDKAGMPLLSCAASIKIVVPVKSYVFKTAQTDSLAVSKLIDYCKRNQISKVGFINDSNAFGASGRDQWKDLAMRSGIQTLAWESFGSADTDMTAQLTKIRGARPQAIVCWGTNPGPAILAKDAKILGLRMPLLMSHGIANSEFMKIAGSAAEGVVFPSGKIIVANAIPASDPQKNVLVRYAADYQKAYGKPAVHFGGHAWDAVKLVAAAINKVGPDRAKIRQAIENTKNFVGIDGVFNMTPRDHNGLNKSAFVMIKVVKGKWTLIK
jgi:branched-chain amino acid transport system substrate-binding protein